MVNKLYLTFRNETFLRDLFLVSGAMFLVATVIFGVALRQWRTGDLQLESLKSLAKVSATVHPVPNDRIKSIAEFVRTAHPAVQIEASDVIRVSVRSTFAYSQWQEAVFGVMKAAPDAVWQVRRLCAGECAQGGLLIELVPTQLQLSVT